jgi:hypothetical protein
MASKPGQSALSASGAKQMEVDKDRADKQHSDKMKESEVFNKKIAKSMG